MKHCGCTTLFQRLGERVERGDVGMEEAVTGGEGALCEAEGRDGVVGIGFQETLDESLSYETFSSDDGEGFEWVGHGLERGVEGRDEDGGGASEHNERTMRLLVGAVALKKASGALGRIEVNWR